MKHIALRARSMRNINNPYTTPGLGDRIHSVYLAYQYSVANNTAVTIHLDAWKYGKPHKLASWKEIQKLFPADSVFIEYHDPVTPTDQQWIEYLNGKGIPAEFYYYKDTIDTKAPIEISQYINNPVLVQSNQQRSKVITTQWISTDNSRSISPIVSSSIEQQYIDNGYKVVNLDNNVDQPLQEIAEIMSDAELHLGVDSGMYHMALLYHKFANIHLYSKSNGFVSHHAVRAKNNGVKYITI